MEERVLYQVSGLAKLFVVLALLFAAFFGSGFSSFSRFIHARQSTVPAMKK